MRNNGNALAWLALIVAILALILAWSAFNRSGEDVQETVDDVVEEVSTEDQSAAAADAMDENTEDDAMTEEEEGTSMETEVEVEA